MLPGRTLVILQKWLMGLLVALLPAAALAQTASWPASPIRVIVPYPPGSSGDIILRRVAPLVAAKLGGTLFVDNRPGANGHLAVEAVKNAAPDGYTFLLGSDIQFAISPALYSKLPFDPERDFKPVGPLARIDLVLVSNPKFRANNIAQLVALARAEPGKLTYASTGIGSSHQLYMELFKIRNGIDILHVPYRGTGHATPDIISGQVDIMFFGSAQAISGVEGGQIKALGAGSLQRLGRLPQVATIAEAGNPDFAANNLWGVWAPAGTPDATIDKLRRAIVEVLADPDVRKFYRDSALTTLDGGVDEMVKVIREQRAKWPEVIKAANIEMIE
jgi:tripartite-type tricarboxylate transporter receptor subunit TctC